jgi:ABC-type glutathione transport system ATPase component
MSTPILSARSIVKTFGKRSWLGGAGKARRAVDTVDLDINEGETLAIVGESGSGKSTLAVELARNFNTLHVAEFGRELWETKQGSLLYEDMLQIAERQVEMEEKAAGRANWPAPLLTRAVQSKLRVDHVGSRAG